jgi:UDP-N-acetylglucosamine transferase subunit ALG13
VIFVGVGTFMHGFDDLVLGADRAAAALGVQGFAQIGHSTIVPRHLDHARFLPPAALRQRLAASRVAVCHAGMGLIGDALRARCRLILVPRRGATTRDHPANDQRAFAERLTERLAIRLCLDPADLATVIAAALADETPAAAVPESTVPALLRAFLGGQPQSRPASSS